MSTTADISAEHLSEVGHQLLSLDPVTLEGMLLTMEPHELALAEQAIAYVEREISVGTAAAAEWRATPATMAHHLTGGRYRLWRYTRLLGEKFLDAVEGRSTRQIWNLPARYGKSWLASQWGPTWALDRDPRFKLILISYGDDLAVENAIAVRDALREHSDQLRAELRRDRQRQDRFVTTEGGGILAAGIMSAITGFGGNGVIFDDPYKDWQEAHSQARRDLIDNQYRAVVTLRLETEDAFTIIVHTRWHEDDQTGRLQGRMEDGTGEAFEVVRLPALAEPHDPHSLDPLLRIPDPLGRAPGEPLEPERFSLTAVKGRQLSLGSYLTASLEQQRPAPEEGGEFKRTWWRIDANIPPAFDTMLTSWDMKLKDKESGDYVVGQTWGRTGSSYWLLAQLRGQWNQATTENAIALAATREPRCRAHIVENTGNGPEVMEALRDPKPGYQVSDEIAGLLGMTEDERLRVSAVRQRGMPGIIAQTVKGSKTVRARAVSGYVEAGNVHLRANAAWLGVFLDELSAFDNGAHDDQVDAFSQALARLVPSQVTVSVPNSTIAKPPINTRGPNITRIGFPGRGR